MTYEQAIFWYQTGLGVVLAFAGGPFLLVVLIRWVRSFLAS